MEESKLFKNEDVLNPEYLPEMLPHRESQIQVLARNIESLARKRKPQNTFVVGPPGLGKTASVKFVFRQFEEYSGIHTIYINTWDYNTSLSVLTKIVLSLNYPVPTRGISKSEVIEKLIELLKKLNKGLVVCLDEVDQLIKKDENALYDLLRINQYVDLPLCLIMISNYKDIFLNLEPRIKSSLDIEELEFKPYTLQEMKDILQKRCEEAFRQPVEEGVVLLCANHAISRGGDVRVGLECLRKASRIAEDENSDKITVKHVRQILSEVKSVKLNLMKEKLEGVEKNIVGLLEGKELTSNQLYDEYVKNFGKISSNALRKHVKHLESIGLVRVKITREGNRGRKYFISLVKRKIFK